MAEATLTMTNLDIARRVGRYAGFTADDTGWTSAETTEIEHWMNRGLRMMLAPRKLPNEEHTHKWSFLYPWAEITVWPTTTGTVSGVPVFATTSTITATASKFYPSMVGASFVFDTSGTSYTIVGYTSATVITVAGDASGETSGDTFTITATGAYRCEDDFGGQVSRELLFAANEEWDNRIPLVTSDSIRRRYHNTDSPSRPSMAAVEPVALDRTVGQRWQTILWPIPEKVYVLTRQYIRNLDKATAVAQYIVGPYLTECWLEHCLAAVESEAEDNATLHADLAFDRLIAAVNYDRGVNVPAHLGYSGGHEERMGGSVPRNHNQIVPSMNMNISINGVEY